MEKKFKKEISKQVSKEPVKEEVKTLKEKIVSNPVGVLKVGSQKYLSLPV